ncbi:MAG: 50S ribosomal protein L11 methyltransferase [Candidatus Rokubacteria bacterium]|nr:50S ribosomal protein L11 methyltransferase [Candidatus Rokubacteria bacterium]
MPFWELTVPASAEVSEALTNFLWEQGALGVIEEEIPSRPPRLRAFFPDTTSSTALCQAVSHYVASLCALGLTLNGGEPLVAPLLDEAWAEAWRQAFTPQRVGRRLLIIPPWETPVMENGLRPIIIEPGRAFGTGTHGSTRGCLVLLEALLDRQPVAHALDVGTGSGILAIAAAVLGVQRVTALDTDPDAVTAAGANIELNGVANQIHCVLSDTASVKGPALALVLANLLAGSHLALAPRYRRLVSPAGHLILGGVLADEAAGIRDALAAHGFALADQVEIDGWVSLQLTR